MKARFPFHDVSDLHNVFCNKCSPFKVFISLQFTMTDQNCSYINNNPCEHIDKQFNYHTVVVTNNCKYYNLQDFKSLSIYSRLSLLLCSITPLCSQNLAIRLVSVFCCPSFSNNKLLVLMEKQRTCIADGKLKRRSSF